MQRYPLILSILICGVFACKRLDVPPPPCATEVPEIHQDTSYLSTPLILPTQLIETKLNQAIGQNVLNDDDFENINKKGKNDKLKLKITRLGDIQVEWKDNVARYQAPLLVLIQREIVSKDVLPSSKSLAIKTEFSLRLVFETTVNIHENWQLDPKTRLVSYHWLSEVKAFGGMIDLKHLVEKRLSQQMPQILANVDSTIQAKVKLEKVITRVWKNLQKPIRVNREKSLVWLKIHPIRFEIGTITSDSGNLRIQSRLSATTEMMLGENPDYSVDSVLPPLIKRPSLPNETYLYVVSVLPYEDIDAVLDQQLKGKSFDISGHHIRIKSAEVWGCGPSLMLHLAVRDAVKGDIYFKGTPQYDPVNQQITIQDFEFELKTEEALVSSADWLLHSTFKEEMKNALSIHLAEHMAKIPAAIMKGIEQGKAGAKMDFTIERWDLRPQQIWVRPEDIAALLIVHAQVRVELEKI